PDKVANLFGSKKMFFFASNEIIRASEPRPLAQVTVPTALERAGNFSQTLDTNGKLIVIRDPLTGQPFQNNIIQPNRIDPNGQKLLSVFPLPNRTDRAITGGNYNYNFQDAWNSKKSNTTFRVDSNITDNLRAFVRYSLWREDNVGYGLGGCQNSP